MTKHHIDGLVGVNTQKNYAQFSIHQKDNKLFETYTRMYGGGISGRPIRRFACDQIRNDCKEIQRQSSHLKLIHVGGISTYAAMQESRCNESVILREWYTGMMHALATNPFEKVYKSMVEGNNGNNPGNICKS